MKGKTLRMLNKEEYQNIKTPEELMDFMDKYIEYGFRGTDDFDYKTDGSVECNRIFEKAMQKVYGLESPDYLLKCKLGQCLDQVELERDWFKKNNYDFKTIYMMFIFEYENPYTLHAYLIYKDKITDEYIVFEHADYNNKGIHRFNSYASANKWQKNALINYNILIGNKVTKKEIDSISLFEDPVRQENQ